MGVDIEVRSIAHVMYDGHDVPVSVMHDEGPRRGPAPPGERRAAGARGPESLPLTVEKVPEVCDYLLDGILVPC